jgi:hypothetical protein
VGHWAACLSHPTGTLTGRAAVTPRRLDAGALRQNFQRQCARHLFTVQKILLLLRNAGAIVVVSSAVHFIGVPVYTTYEGNEGRPILICQKLGGQTQGPQHPS